MSDTTHELQALREENQRLQREADLYRGIVDQLSIGIYVYQLEELADDRTLRMIAANPVVEQLTGLPPAKIVGNTLDQNFPGLRDQGVPQAFAEVIRSGQPFETEQVYGDDRIIESAFTFRGVALSDNCIAVMFENITQRKRIEQELHNLNAELEQRIAERTAELQESRTLLQEMIENQRKALSELSTPLIPIADDVVIMPLIGTIDSGRAQMVMETLLLGVAQHQSELAILDITGVPMVDTQVAQALMRSAQAVKLLGAKVMLTGIQPQIAQTLIHLGVDLTDITTCGSLQDGIALALQRYSD